MNAPFVPVAVRRRIKLHVDDFRLLRERGLFAGNLKTELLDGAIWYVPRPGDGEVESDRMYEYKLTVADYALVSDAGSLAGQPKTELIDGVIYRMSPQYRRHGYVKDELAYRLRRALEAIGSDLHVATEQSVRIDPHAEPQPDIILTREPRGDGPIPVGSVALIVEIAASTLDYDLGEKLSVYASASVPEYWVVDPGDSRVLCHMEPVDGDYAERVDVPFGERLISGTINGLEVASDRLE